MNPCGMFALANTAMLSLFLLATVVFAVPLPSLAQSLAKNAKDHDELDRLTMTTDAVAPLRFIAAHGQRAVMMGYPAQGLEMWAYPVQVCSNYRIEIRAEGEARATPGELLLRRIEVRPQDATRIYVGANFVVRERIFVPLDRPGVIVTYTVEGRKPVDITVHFTPVLDLMWPAAVGGQSVQWNNDLSGYVLSEPLHRFGAVIASPDIVAHDSTENSAVRLPGMAFTVRTTAAVDGERRARVFVGLDQGDVAPGAELKALAANQPGLEAQATEHYAALMTRALRIETPDAQVNQALGWAEVALDQAWVCDPGVGCGLVAGYGPSRTARRPQYDWFFAGDGLVASDGLIAVGEYTRAREELEFILKYQDAKTGMIWHELSQSAGYLDWVGKYPYMYVHVDITFQFLGTIARYIVSSGDADFARQHWAALESAYRYCQAQIDPVTHLPRIPEGKEGGNEQDRMRDDLGLSSQWLSATASFAEVARVTGHSQQAEAAQAAAEMARPAIAARYWDADRAFWISGHNDAGKPIFEERSHAGGLINQHVFTPQQNATLLDKLASADFQTDWGTRGVSAAGKTYDPDAYARGSIFVLSTSGMASTFWQAHRPVTAEGIWSTLPPLAWLDAPGHMHEVLAGDTYRQQTESVPEQTWSSGGFLDATVRGLLGLDIRTAAKDVADTVVFAPHLPADWKDLSLRNVRVRNGTLDLTLHRSDGVTELDIRNEAESLAFDFDPEIPLGARLLEARCNGRRTALALERNAQDEHARLHISAPRGATHCAVRYRGGVEVVPDRPHALVGDASRGLKITHVSFEDSTLKVEADALAGEVSGFDLKTDGRPETPSGVQLDRISKGRYRATIHPEIAGAGVERAQPRYVHHTVRIRVADVTRGAGSRR